MYFVYHPCLSYAKFFQQQSRDSLLPLPMVGGHQTGENFHFETVEVGTRDRQTSQW